MTVPTQAIDRALATWNSLADDAPFVIVPCGACGGFGTNRVHFSGRLHDYTDGSCHVCRGDGEVAVANPAYAGSHASDICRAPA